MKNRTVIVLLASLLLFTFTACTSPVVGVIEALDAGNYQEAAELYDKRVDGKEGSEQDVAEELHQRIQANFDAFNREHLSYDAATQVLDGIRQCSILPDEEIWEAMDALDALVASKAAFHAGEEFMAEGDYEAAIAQYKAVIGADTFYDQAWAQRKAARACLADAALQRAEALASEHDYDKALHVLEQNADIFDDTDCLEEKQDALLESWKAYILAEAKALVQANDYASAIDCLENAPDRLSISPGLAEGYRSQWIEYAIAQAAEVFAADKDYEGAIRLLQGTGIIDARIDAEIDKYQAYIPILLTDLEYVQKGWALEIGAAEGAELEVDLNNNTYDRQTVMYCETSYHYGDVTEEDSYVVYYLNAEYAQLTGYLYRPYQSLGSTSDWTKPGAIRIYGDKILLYETTAFTKDCYDILQIDVDVTGVRELRIEITGLWTNPKGVLTGEHRYSKACAAEMALHK